jgi:hypothetical protein
MFDYIRRAQPFNQPGSLTDDEVYALTAWLLFRNQIIAADQVSDAETLPNVRMPIGTALCRTPARMWTNREVVHTHAAAIPVNPFRRCLGARPV